MDKLFYSIGEVSEILGLPISKIRFWANSFPKQIKPQRNLKGNRQFTAADIEVFKTIVYLVEEKGLTLEGAAKQLQSSSSGVNKTVKAIESLKSIRAQLVEIKHGL